MNRDITYERYMEIREEMLPTLHDIYGETEASKIYSSNNDAPNLVKSPSTSPPPYQKVPPTVIQWESKCMKDDDNPNLVVSPQSPPTPPPTYEEESPDGLQWWQKYYQKMQEDYKRKKNTSASNRSYRSIPPCLIDPYDDVEVDKLQKSIDNASIKSQKHYQPPTYDPKVVYMHKRSPKFEISVPKDQYSRGINHNGNGSDGGDRGINTFFKF